MTTLSSIAARVAAASLALMPVLASAQANCGVPGTPPCPTPEPGSWPLVALALGVLAAVKFIRRK
ncbi:PEP-CTERM sorting domain-containing protein [Roseateles sp. NT4]|uniref:PEP-CTERM sorting domain-containing protein n=1 Tax=Roseateles sp. NT4 TaxID=3453715 RepID=UPI003EEBECBF